MSSRVMMGRPPPPRGTPTGRGDHVKEAMLHLALPVHPRWLWANHFASAVQLPHL